MALVVLALASIAGAVVRRLRQRSPGWAGPAEAAGGAWPPLTDVAVAPGPEHSPVRRPGEHQTPPGPDDAGWVAPSAGACPDTHPIKAKVATGIFHLPGMANYARTSPDRCYRDEAAAEADGLRRAKR